MVPVRLHFEICKLYTRMFLHFKSLVGVRLLVRFPLVFFSFFEIGLSVLVEKEYVRRRNKVCSFEMGRREGVAEG